MGTAHTGTFDKNIFLAIILALGVCKEAKIPKIFDFVTSNTDLTKDQILTQFIPTKRHLLGVKGVCPS